MALTTRRPVLPPGEALPYVYLDGTFYFDTSFMANHANVVREMGKQGVPASAIQDAIFGYVSNDSDDSVPHYRYDTVSDLFPSDPNPDQMADLATKLQAWFPGIKLNQGMMYEGSSWTIQSQSDNISDMTPIETAIQNDSAAQTAIEALTRAGGRVFVVGGAVRDAILGASPKDIDLMCQGLDEDEIIAALNPLGRLDFTGKQFGVFRFKNGDSEVEIALPRTETSTGPGHKDFQVTTDPYLDPETDLARRDFTGNAMAYEPATGALIDPHGGAEDLQSKRLSLVNDRAFEDDPLRVVRALVANARFGLEPDPALKQSLKDNAHKITDLPGERVQMELDKLLSSNDPAKAIQLAEESDLIPYLVPELNAAVGFDQKNPHHDLDVFQHTMQVLRAASKLTSDPDIRLAALLHDSGKPDSFWLDENAPDGGGGHFYKKIMSDGTIKGQDHEDVGAQNVRAFMERLRYPKARIDRVEALVQHHMFPYFNSLKGARRFLRSLNGDVKMAFDLLTLREADASGKLDNEPNNFDRTSVDKARQLLQEAIEAQADQGQGFTLKDLAVNGNDMVQLGLKGRQIGQALNKLLDLVVDNPELNDHDTLMKVVKEGV